MTWYLRDLRFWWVLFVQLRYLETWLNFRCWFSETPLVILALTVIAKLSSHSIWKMLLRDDALWHTIFFNQFISCLLLKQQRQDNFTYWTGYASQVCKLKSKPMNIIATRKLPLKLWQREEEYVADSGLDDVKKCFEVHTLLWQHVWAVKDQIYENDY